ncbi:MULTISPECIES: phosphate acyltransferase [Rhodococcus]|uniref:phosphate acyltransferase n=1 Tax=Rhodococcus TaxID=1827 RepID=UPI00101FB8DB|nr:MULTISPECIES: phosphate acyltransferase [Rhodococcus]UTT51110.1 phosphate acyltransferase [Rhodococcus gordoniae]
MTEAKVCPREQAPAWRDVKNVSSSARVLFLEGEDPRMVRAAVAAGQAGMCRPVLWGPEAQLKDTARALGLDISSVELLDVNADLLRDLQHDACGNPSHVAEDPEFVTSRAYAGAMLVESGWVDAAVGGARASSADILRAAMTCIGLAPDRSTVSGAIFLDTQRSDIGSSGTLAFADAVVTPLPTVEQLVDIAAATAKSWRSLMLTQPRIAFLSFSTKGSSGSRHVDRVREAVRLFRQKYPDELVDGELQFDAAVSSSVAARKSVTGTVAGSANILVFPSLDSANIAYKVAEQFGQAHARAILQGLGKPFADVSRGCTVDDIVSTVGMLLYDALHTREIDMPQQRGAMK